MKGIIFRLLESFVVEGHDMMVWDNALENCDLASKGIYIGTEKYPDEELFQLISYLSKQLQTSQDDILRQLGQYVFPSLYQTAFDVIKHAKRLREFLLMVDDVIHVEVRKLHPDAHLPKFDYMEHKTKLVMQYRSPRQLCHFSEGLILAAAEHFNEHVEINQPICMHKGGEFCEIHIVFK